MKRSMKNALTVAGITALLAMAAPPAMAGPEDVPDCTTTYVDTVDGPYLPPSWPPATLTYTPPARPGVDASPTVDYAVALGVHVVDATVTYVYCVD